MLTFWGLLASGWVRELAHDIIVVGVTSVIYLIIWSKFIAVSISRYKSKRRIRHHRYYIRSNRRHRTKLRCHKLGNKRDNGRITWLHACASLSKSMPSTDHRRTSMPFDSDSFEIAIDNCASSHFTNTLTDFVTKKRINSVVRGIGNGTITHVGTVCWTIQDDQGRRHKLNLDNVYYQPSLPWRLLSPQTLAQDRKNEHGTGCLTLGRHMELFWDNKRFKRTVPLTATNIGIMYSAPSNKKFYAFAGTVSNLQDSPHVIPFNESEIDPVEQSKDSHSQAGNITTTASISTNLTTRTNTTGQSTNSSNSTNSTQSDEQKTNNSTGQPTNSSNSTNSTQSDEQQTTTIRSNPVPIDFGDTTQPSNGQQTNNDLTSDQWELLKLHYRLGHISMHQIRAIAKYGLLKKKYANTPPPMCASCQYGKATRRPWRTKATPSQINTLKPIHKPGDCVSIDQTESPQPGLIGQLKGKMTTKRYKVATIFVDHFSRLSYIYLQTSTSGKETVEAKKAFEAYCQSINIRVQHYHADNGRFADNEWLADVARKGQSISFCGVGAHFQNGIAEKWIRDLQESARTMMLQASLRWPKAHSTALWPYALRMASEIINHTPRSNGSDKSPIEIFTSSHVRPKLSHFHTFGCPVYVLENSLQSGKSAGKWNPRSRVGIYLGPSPRHARSVSLVLNPKTGLVSPQWHVKHDEIFQTVINREIEDSHGNWK